LLNTDPETGLPTGVGSLSITSGTVRIHVMDPEEGS